MIAKSIRIVMKLGVIERDRLPGRQRCHRWLLLLLSRHRCTLHQHGDDRHVATERFLDFELHDVFRVIETAHSRAIADRRPSRTNHDEHDGRFAQRELQHADEVGAWINRVDVEEYLTLTESLVQVIGQTSGLAGRIVSPVADKDPWWHQGFAEYHVGSPNDRSAAWRLKIQTRIGNPERMA